MKKIYKYSNALFDDTLNIVKDLYIKNKSKLKDTIVIVPDRRVFDKIKSCLYNKIDAFSTNNIFTLNDIKNMFTSNMRAEAGINEKYLLNDTGKRLIIKNIVEDIKKEYNKDKSISYGSYINSLVNHNKLINDIILLVSTIKSAYNIYKNHDDIFKFAVDKLASENFSKNKYNDIKEIIKRYKNNLKKLNHIDNEDITIDTVEWLKNNKAKYMPFKNIKNIHLTGVFNTRMIDLELINAVAESYDCDISITLYKGKSNTHITEYLSQKGFKAYAGDKNPSSDNNKDMSILIKSLFSNDPTKRYNINISNIKERLQPVELNGKFDEVLYTGKMIKDLMLDKNINPEDILITASNINDYKIYIKDVFNKIGVDVFVSAGENILNSKLVYVLLNIIELKLFGFRYSNFIKLVKSNYVFIKEDGKFTRNYAYEIEKFFADRKIDELHFDSQIKKYIEKHKNNPKYSYTISNLENALNYIMLVKKIFEKSDSEDRLPEADEKTDFYDIAGAYKSIIEKDLNILLNVFSSRSRSKEQEYYTRDELEVSKRDSVVFSKFLNLIEELGFYYNHIGKKLSLREFYNTLKQHLQSINFHEDTSYKNKIQAYNIKEASALKFKYVFVLGLIENGFPGKYPTSIYITERDRHILNNICETNIIITKEVFYHREEDYFKLLLASAQDKIYLSYSNTNEDKPTLKSFFIDEVIEILHENSEYKEKDELKEYLFAKVSESYHFKEELLDDLLASYADDLTEISNLNSENVYDILITECDDIKNRAESFIPDVDTKLINKLQNIVKAEILRENTNIYNDYDGYIFFADEDNLIAGKLEEMLETISPTSFELYGKCPVRYYYNKILGVKEPKSVEEMLLPTVRGTTVHYILERFYKEHVKDEIQNITLDNFEEKQKELDLRLDTIIKEEFDKLNDDNKISNYEVFKLNQMSNLREKIFDFFHLDLTFLVNNKYSPFAFEYTFNEDPDTADMLELYDSGGKHIVNVRGSIDRVDKPAEELKMNIRVSDYKTEKSRKSKDKILKAINNGTMFQPTLYAYKILSDFDKDSVDWTFYYIFNLGTRGGPPIISFTKGSKEIAKSIGLIKEYKDYITKGKFNIAVRDCPGYCQYSSACRVIKHKAYEKLINTDFWGIIQ